MSVEDAKATVMPIVLKEKKAALIRSKASATTLEALAKAQNATVQSASAVNMKNPMITGVGREPLVVGAAFGLKEGQTSKLIDGANGVYMIKVTKITPAAKLDSYQAVANRVEQQKLNVVSSKLYNALKEVSDIEDNRAENQIQ
jgi:parvulin-like peptidyl-prolyl isomerase